MIAVRLAPAKVNLFLHVGPLGADGYHPLASWMVFADVGDTVRLEAAEAWSFAVEGPFARAIGDGPNLVERAAAALFERTRTAAPVFRLVLDKQLPVAAGLGGGSSDAGAALLLLNAVLERPCDEAALIAIAAELGADGPACLAATPVLAQGRGDELTAGPLTAPLPAVLINPLRPSSTAAVYRTYDEGPVAAPDLPPLAAAYDGPAAVAAALAASRNDLQRPAAALEPAIADVLDWLVSQPETLLARMSGSGATCFALCASDADAAAIAARRLADRPHWWGAACRLR